MAADPSRAPAQRNLDRSLGDGGMPLLAELGLSFDDYGEGWSAAVWVPTELACNPAGIVQGGVYGVIHDAAMNFAVNSALVHGEVTQLTRQIAYVASELRSDDDRVVSQATATFLLRRREGEGE